MSEIDDFQAKVTRHQRARKPPKKPANGHSAPEFGAAPELPSDAPFQVLGFQRKRLYCFAADSHMVIDYAPRDLHSVAELLHLAKLDWWKAAFPSPTGDGPPFAVTHANNALIRAGHARGIYDPARVRGRGVYMDENRVVVHLGDRLLVDGKPQALGQLGSQWLYERAAHVDFDTDAEPATDEEAGRLEQLCAQVSFVNPERDCKLLAGWLVLAMIGGVMRWRPHVWINSEAGEGKTWIIEHIAAPLLGGMAVLVAANSTEPGIRRATAADALALLFDEAEAETPDDLRRLRAIINLLRQAASDSSATILQAKRNGADEEMMRYRPRFPALLGSVNLSLSQAADESRFLVMPLQESSSGQFKKLQRWETDTFTPGFSARLFARIVGMVPVILTNHTTLRDAIAKYGNKRSGDTLGATLAGYFALRHGHLLTQDEAEKWVQDNTWLQEAAREQVPEKDWRRLLTFIGQQRLRIPSSNGARELNVSEAISMVSRDTAYQNGLLPEDVQQALEQVGLRVMTQLPKLAPGDEPEPVLLISNESAAVARWVATTPWAAGWKTTLARATDCRRPGPQKFNRLSERCLAVPLRVFFDDEGVVGDTQEEQRT